MDSRQSPASVLSPVFNATHHQSEPTTSSHSFLKATFDAAQTQTEVTDYDNMLKNFQEAQQLYQQQVLSNEKQKAKEEAKQPNIINHIAVTINQTTINIVPVTLRMPSSSTLSSADPIFDPEAAPYFFGKKPQPIGTPQPLRGFKQQPGQ